MDTKNRLTFRMPAEWEPHAATWLAWPHNRNDWPGKFEPIPWVYAEIIRYLARHERVEVIVNDITAEKKVRKILELANAWSENVSFRRWPTNRVWTRDSGCTFVVSNGHVRTAAFDRPPEQSSQRTSKNTRRSNGSLASVKWRFNAWAKYSNWKLDEKIGSLMAKAASAEKIPAVCGKQCVVLEGGSIDVNGCGTLLTTEECLLSKVQQRNPRMRRAAYEQVFADYFGVQSVIWLDSGITGDDTHGHVDDITRFVAPNTVVTMIEQDERSENYAALQANLGRLKNARTSSGKKSDGRKLEIVEIPLPRPVVFEGRQLPASYANFYIANGAVLVPVFNDPNDRIALNALAELFPAREIVPIYCGDLIWGFGALHCMTQQQPSSGNPERRSSQRRKS